MPPFFQSVALFCCFGSLPGMPAALDDFQRRADEALLGPAGVTDQSLLLLVRQHTLTPAERRQVEKLLEELGDHEYKVRDRASRVRTTTMLHPIVRDVRILAHKKKHNRRESGRGRVPDFLTP